MRDNSFIKGSRFIKKRAQLKFVAHFCISILVGAVISMAIFYLYTYKELGGSHYQALFALLGLKQDILPAIVFTCGIVVIFITLAVLMITLVNSHRIAGPVYRLERGMESIGNGDLSIRIKFRQHDAISRLADDINTVADALNLKISEIAGSLKDIKKEAEALRSNPGDSPAILIEKIRLAKKTVSGFKTE